RVEGHEIGWIDGLALGVEVGNGDIGIAARVVTHGPSDIPAAATPYVSHPEPRLGLAVELGGRVFDGANELRTSPCKSPLTLNGQDRPSLAFGETLGVHQISMCGTPDGDRRVIRLVIQERKVRFLPERQDRRRQGGRVQFPLFLQQWSLGGRAASS